MSESSTLPPIPKRSTIVVPGAASDHDHDHNPHHAPNVETGVEGADPQPVRLRWSPFASFCILFAIGVLIAVEVIGSDSIVRAFPYGIWLTVGVLVMALGASFWPTGLSGEGLFLLWNGLGLSVGVLGIGVLGVSSMLALPLVLIGVAVTTWPRWPDQPLLPLGSRVVLIGGIFVLPLLALVQWIGSRFF